MKHSSRELFTILAIILVASLTHLVGLSEPQQVIFDEVHFGKFVTAYCCTGERIFDIHPPHVKLLIAAVGWLGGYRGGFPFEYIGQPYGDVPIAALRLVPALAGIILPLIIYLLLRQLGASWRTGVVGAAFIILDNALTVQTRLISLDGVLLVSTFGSLSTFLKAVAPPTRQRWVWFAATGALAGLAVGSKFTGLAAPALLVLLGLWIWWQQSPRERWSVWLGRVAIAAICFLVIYLGGWALHFAILHNPGSGDAFGVPGPIADPNPFIMFSQFLHETIRLHHTMFEANYNLTATHPDMSPWWSWPLMLISVFYWTADNGQRLIYFLGNPVVWWGSTTLFLTAVISIVAQLWQRQSFKGTRWWIPLLGYAIAMVPLVRIPRALFLYHYLTPLIFTLLFGLVWIDQQSWWRKSLAPVICVLVALVGFLWFSPITYGWATTPAQQAWIFWLTSWR